MKGRRLLSAALAAAMLMSGLGGEANARAIPRQHIKGHLRVDGSSDLRGQVRARSGLHVTVGITTDSLTSTGPVQLGGILTVAGVATTGGLNTGSAPVTTTGSLQGGTLATTGDASVGGSLGVSKTLTAGGASLGAGGLQVAGAVSGSSAAFSGAVGAGSLTTSGPLTAGSATFARLAVAPGGAVNFNNASITGVAGLSLTGSANLSSLQITTAGAGGASGTQALTITQAGNAAALSVAAPGILTVSGQGLATPSLTVANNASVGGTLSTNHVSSTSGITLDAPAVSTSHDLVVGAGGNLRLDPSSVHVMGNHDTRGQCAVAVTTPGTIQTCPVSFGRAYAAAPVVVATPAGTDPTMVTGYAVQTNTAGFTISFTARSIGSVTFNYVVEG